MVGCPNERVIVPGDESHKKEKRERGERFRMRRKVNCSRTLVFIIEYGYN